MKWGSVDGHSTECVAYMELVASRQADARSEMFQTWLCDTDDWSRLPLGGRRGI